MSLLDLFNQKAKVQPPQKRGDADEQLDVYSGMRVEVTTDAGEILFVAKLLGLHGDNAELHQYSESEIAQDIGTIHARIRGYSDYERKAVYMEGVITSGHNLQRLGHGGKALQAAEYQRGRGQHQLGAPVPRGG